MNGLIPNSSSKVSYEIAGVVQPDINVDANGSGVAAFPVLLSTNGIQVVITTIERTDISPSCLFTPLSGNSVVLTKDTYCSVISPSQCNTTLVNMEDYIYSTLVSNAQAYLWRVTTLTGINEGQVQTKQTALRQFRLSMLATFAYDRQYKVEVAVMRNDVWGPYTDPCTITTPTITTQLQPCGSIIAKMTDYVACGIVSYATKYKFIVTNSQNPSDTQTIVSGLRNFKMSQFTNVQCGTTYNVKVQVGNTDGTYLDAGSTCTVTTNVTPTFDAVAPIYTGGTLSPLPTTSKNGVTGTWLPALNNATTTEYTFTPTSGLCAASVKMSIVVHPVITPAFTTVAPICSGTTLAALPTTSLEGTTGSWSPAPNNTATTTYTFTPDAGQFASSTTLTITVNAAIVPTFTAVAPMCDGATATPLPTTSNNGISGTWSPAINRYATTTYTFTPTVGQCATTTTQTIEVNPIIPLFDEVAIIGNRAINYQLPTTSTNGITGVWDYYFLEEGDYTYTFTPNDGQCAQSITMDFMVLLPKKLEAEDDEFAFAIANPQSTITDLTTESVLNNDLGWDTFGDVTLSVVSMTGNVYPYDPNLSPTLHQNGTITIPHRFWWINDSNIITYKITQNSCASNYAIATVNISSYNPNATARMSKPNKQTNASNLIEAKIAFYPNPSNGIFNLDLTNVTESYDSIKVYNIIGAMVYENRLTEKSLNQVDISQFTSGFYTARLFNGENSTTIKLIKK